jgi:lipoate-protein ligase A
MLATMTTSKALTQELTMLDEVSERPDEVMLSIWEGTQSIVAPSRFQNLERSNEAVRRSENVGWPIHYRCTGGDVTPQGRGIINISLAYALPPGMPPEIDTTFSSLCAPIRTALGTNTSYGNVDGAFCDGAYNILLNGKKFAGTAQRFRRCKADQNRFAVLSHAILLMSSPSAQVINTLNLYLDAIGADRHVVADRHTGLPKNLDQSTFIAKAHAQYKAAFPQLRNIPAQQFKRRIK